MLFKEGKLPVAKWYRFRRGAIPFHEVVLWAEAADNMRDAETRAMWAWGNITSNDNNNDA